MASGEGFSSNKAPLFDVINYSFWRLGMQTYLNALGYEIWEVTKNGYIVPSMPIIDAMNKKTYESNLKATNFIMCGLVDSELVKVMNRESIKE